MKSIFSLIVVFVALSTELFAQHPAMPKTDQPTQLDIPSVGLILVRDCSPKLLECINHFKKEPELTLLAERMPMEKEDRYQYPQPIKVTKASARVIKIKSVK